MPSNLAAGDPVPAAAPDPAVAWTKGAGAPADLGAWLQQLAARAGLDVQAIRVPYETLAGLTREAGPALLGLPAVEGRSAGVLVLLKGGRRWVTLIGPDQGPRRVRTADLRKVLADALEAPLRQEASPLLDGMGLNPRRRCRVEAAFLRERLRGVEVTPWWLVQLPPGAPFAALARQGRLFFYLVISALSHAGTRVTRFAAWWVIGWAMLQGTLDAFWLGLWALITMMDVPCWLAHSRYQNRFRLSLGLLIKQRLLQGIQNLDVEDVQRQGVGQFLSWAFSLETAEDLTGAQASITLGRILSLFMIAGGLAAGAGGLLHAALLLGWLAVITLLAAFYYLRYRRYNRRHDQTAKNLLEKMIGHPTRLVQLDRSRWHDEEDPATVKLWRLKRSADRAQTLLLGLAPSGWLLVSFVALAPSFAAERATTASLAASLLGILLAFDHIQDLVPGVRDIVQALVAWQEVAPLARAARDDKVSDRDSVPRLGPGALDRATLAPGERLLSASDLRFRYRSTGRYVVDQVGLQIQAGERLLLRGPSGGGKSTLVSLLAGLQSPESGLVLLRGMDWPTLGGRAWRRQIVVAPQFHENHLASASLAFNLLMGRRWPPRDEDLQEALAVCGELGLGDLIARMPAGLDEPVGEGGWRLSHGERSRIYIARALLQPAEMVILDESFGAIDPENLYVAMQCVLRRAPTLLVIAHP